jgi:hypothetical protein
MSNKSNSVFSAQQESEIRQIVREEMAKSQKDQQSVDSTLSAQIERLKEWMRRRRL